MDTISRVVDDIEPRPKLEITGMEKLSRLGKGLFLSAVCVLALSNARPCVAATISNLYEATVPVAGQTPEERKQGIRKALDQVIIKLTGSLDTPTLPQAAPIADAASNLVEQYRYQDAAGSMQEPSGQKEPAQMLWVRFDAQALNKRLRDAGLPVWGRARPATLAWIAVDDGAGRRFIVGAEDSPEIDALVNEHASQRGIRVLLPLMDLEDRAAVSVADVWASFPDVIYQATQRYAAETSVVGRLYQDFDGSWRGRWTTYIGQDSQSWQAVGETQGQVIAEGIDGLADRLGKRFATQASVSKNALVLDVEDVTSLQDYARVLRYLRSLDGVSNARLLQVDADRIVVVADVQGDAAGLERTISLSNILARVSGGSEMQAEESTTGIDTAAGAPLTFRLLP